MLAFSNSSKLVVLSSLFFFLTFSSPSMAVEPKCPGGSAPDPNWLFCEDFENGNVNRWDNFSPVWVTTAQKIFGSYGGYTQQLKFDGYWGCYGTDVWAPPADWGTEIYIRWYTKISDAYQWGPNEDKLLLLYDYAQTHSGLYVYLSQAANEDACADCGDNTGVGIPGIENYLDCSFESGCSNCTRTRRSQNTGNVLRLAAGHTYLFEWRLKMNTGTNSDGIAQLWIDDVTNGDLTSLSQQTLRCNYSNVRYFKNATGKKWGRLRLTVYAQRWYSDRPATWWISWDNIVVSKQRIGPKGNNLTVPKPPTGLRIVP